MTVYLDNASLIFQKDALEGLIVHSLTVAWYPLEVKVPIAAGLTVLIHVTLCERNTMIGSA